MQTLKHYSIIALLFLFFNCNVSPQGIDYGNDGCHFCKMTIVDKVHAAEIVTKKGKVYTFDATECMVNFLNDFETSEIELYLSNHFSEPEALIDATQATFLISENVHLFSNLPFDSFFNLNMSIASLHAYILPPLMLIISINSSTGGISKRSISFFI